MGGFSGMGRKGKGKDGMEWHVPGGKMPREREDWASRTARATERLAGRFFFFLFSGGFFFLENIQS
jgi:hypothetical protein